MCDSQRAGITGEGGLQGWRSLPGKGGSVSLFQSSWKQCLPCQQGRECGRGGSREGLYLPRTVVQIHQDIQGLKHCAHGVNDD